MRWTPAGKTARARRWRERGGAGIIGPGSFLFNGNFTMAFYWFKALHLVFMVTWFAGLFYLPRLFVYHASATDGAGIERFKVMERKLFVGIMTPGAVLTVLFGIGAYLTSPRPYAAAGWMHAKLALVALLAGYHVWCGLLLAAFRRGANRHSHVWYRWFNEAPVAALIGIVLLAVLGPVSR